MRELGDPGGRSRRTFYSIEPGDKLDLGCGNTPKPGYVCVDLDAPQGAIEHDLTEPFPLESGVVDEIVCEHVVEHFDREEVVPLLDECCRVLREDGVGRLTVPEHGSPGSAWTWERADDGHPDHRDVTAVETLAEDAGKSVFSRFEPRHYWRDGVVRYEPLGGPPPVRRTPDAPGEPFDGAIEKRSLVVDLPACGPSPGIAPEVVFTGGCSREDGRVSGIPVTTVRAGQSHFELIAFYRLVPGRSGVRAPITKPVLRTERR